MRKKVKAFVLGVVLILVCSLLLSQCKSQVSPSDQIYWGAYVGPAHIGNYDALRTFEAAVGRNVSIWNWFQLWNRPQDSENVPQFDTNLMNQARNHGAIPMISWAPESGWSDFPFTNLQSILNGSQDAYLTAWGQAAHEWGHPFFVRLFWEFSGSWSNGVYPFGYGNTGAAEFVQAWQYVVNKVRDSGGTNISWVWCPTLSDSEATLKSLYPGDAYVDWVATDVYLSASQPFDRFILPTINYMRDIASNKPVMLSEVGYGDSNPAAWWNNFLTNTLPKDYPFVKAVVIWEDPLDSSGTLTVTSSATLPTFKDAISSGYYSSNSYSDLGISPIQPIGGYSQTPLPSNQYATSTPNETQPTSNSSSMSGFMILAVAAVIASIAVFGVFLLKRRKSLDTLP